ncbi:MAG: S1 family peptidase [Deltaproteobacteria bacterium]|nr:S1 family peptidase [Deltaproteobacteria bacterium]
MLSLSKKALSTVGALALSLFASGCAAEAQAANESAAVVSQAIVGGSTSTAQHDAVVQLTVAADDGKTRTCSGTLVAKNLVLTARHCVGDVSASLVVRDYAATTISIYAGVDAPARIASGEAPAAVGKELVVPDGNTLLPDVAFVVLDAAVDAPIAPVRLSGGAAKGERLTVVGFGLDESNTAPSARKQREGVEVTTLGPAKTSVNDLAQGEFALGEAACFGDSGGPALSASTRAVVGVASRVSNGVAANDKQDVTRCIGAEDVYTSLDGVKDVVTKAFAAAGAQPTLEPVATAGEAAGDTSPSSETSSSETAPSAPSASVTTSRTTTTMSCAASSKPARSSELALAALIALFCVLTMRRRA